MPDTGIYGAKIPDQERFAMFGIAGRHLLKGLFLAGLVLAPPPIAAQTAAQKGADDKVQASSKPLDVFEIQDVQVDVTAETAAKASEQALAEGERLAYRRLLARLTLSANREGLEEPSAEEISALVKDFEVKEEKTSSVRYLANLIYRFKPEAVREHFIDSYIAFAETPSKPVLILPVYQAAGAVLLFDDPNPWRDAWASRPKTGSLVPTILPRGDLADIKLIGAEQAVEGDAQRLRAVAARYGAGDTLAAQAILGLGAGGGAVLEVFMTRYGTVQVEQTVVKTYAANPGEAVEALLRRAADDLAMRVEDNWKRDNLLEFGRQVTLSVRVPISGLAEWLGIRSKLAAVAVIRKTDVVLINREEVQVNLHYLGDPDQLSLALEQADLILSGDTGDWTLSPATHAGNARGKS